MRAFPTQARVVIIGGGVDLVTNTCWLALVHEHHVRSINWHVFVDDSTSVGVVTTRGQVALGGVYASDLDFVLLWQNCCDLALLAFIFSGNDDDRVTLFELHDYNTSGASEMIRINFLSRSSRPTGPKIRVPRGVRSSLINTAAFSSKRM